MKRTVYCLWGFVIFLSLIIPIKSHADPILAVHGRVTDADGNPIDGLEVTATNVTKNLTQTGITGDSGRGAYGIVLIDFLGNVADAGNAIKVTVRQNGEVIAETTYIITEEDLQGALANISVQIRADAPILNSIQSDSGVITGGTIVQLLGENFQAGATVTVGGSAALEVTFVSSMELTVKIPDGAPGVTQVTVRNLDGQSAAIQFTYFEFPAWDIDQNGAVDILDLVLVGGQFGQTGEGLSGDVDRNDSVDIFDLVLIGLHFGEKTVPVAAPSIHIVSGIFNATPVSEIAKRPDARAILMEAETGRRLRAALTELEGLPNVTPEVRLVTDLLRQWLIANGEIAADTKLLPNYPNPFNPETWIPYQLAHAAEIQISIYDIMGQRVRLLEVGHQHAGVYTNRSEAAYWDGRNDAGEFVTSGVYFYTLRAGNFAATRKLIVLK